MTVHQCAAILLTAMSVNSGAQSVKAPLDATSEFKEWFENLRDPDSTLSCCGESDCRAADERTNAGRYEVRVGDSWIMVPDEKVILGIGNPTGRAVLCWNKVFGILCFVPGAGV
jgi:hypothetical protein